MEMLNRLARAVKWKREKHGLSFKAAAESSKVSATTIRQIEMGIVDPRLGTIVRLAEWVGMSITDVFGDYR